MMLIWRILVVFEDINICDHIKTCSDQIKKI
jgi:hypothetical protein